MLNKSIAPINGNYKELQDLATRIFLDYYKDHIPEKVMRQSLGARFSPTGIENFEKNESMNFFFIKMNGRAVGFIAVQPKNNELFLSKFYIEASSRKKGLGSFAMSFIEAFAKDRNLESIFCFCSQYNKGSLEAYRRLGFHKRGEFLAHNDGEPRYEEMEDILAKKILL